MLRGRKGIANVRYATSGSSGVGALQRNAMPIHKAGGSKAVAMYFNGNVVNVRSLQEQVGVDRRCSDAHGKPDGEEDGGTLS